MAEGSGNLTANQIIQKVIQDMKRISALDCAVWNTKGECIAKSKVFPSSLGVRIRSFIEQMENQRETEYIGEREGMFLVVDGDVPMYALYLQGDNPDILLVGRLGVSQLTNLEFASRERLDKNRFMYNIVLGNILPSDIYGQAERLRIPAVQRRVVFLVESKNNGDNLIAETLKVLFASGMKDFVITVDERLVILIKALEKMEDYAEVNHKAEIIIDTLNAEAMASVRVSYGTIVGELKEIPRSFKEAELALEIGRAFYSEKELLAYNKLGIGRLIHQLPGPLCEMFLKEVFGGHVIESFDEEELTTVYTFFDHNLNISETARALFIHRNTLIYRLEKIQKKTGLDMRVFDDALMFKIAAMVERHINYMKEKKIKEL